MNWEIETFETSGEEKPVDEFIKSQQPQAKAKIAHSVQLLGTYGNRHEFRSSSGIPTRHSRESGNLYQ